MQCIDFMDLRILMGPYSNLVLTDKILELSLVLYTFSRLLNTNYCIEI